MVGKADGASVKLYIYGALYIASPTRCARPSVLQATSSEDYSNNLPLADTVDATSTAYRASSSRSSNDANTANVADANARAQSMAMPREFTMHSFDATGDAYSSEASNR